MIRSASDSELIAQIYINLKQICYDFTQFRRRRTVPFHNTVAFTSIRFKVSIRQTTGIKPVYTTIATVTMNLIVAFAIILLNLYVTACISYQIPPLILSVHIPDVANEFATGTDENEDITVLHFTLHSLMYHSA